MSLSARTHGATARWRWWGTRGSADRGVISVLALVETLAAATVSGYIALRYGTLYLVVSACIAPLLLLRTPASQKLGLEWGPRAIARTFQRIELLLHMLPDTRSRGLLGRALAGTFIVVAFVVLMALGFVVIALVTPVVRFTATLVTFLRTPLQCLRAIPGNWWRNIACVDMTHVPEPLPGIDSIIDNPDFRQEFILLLHPWAVIRLVGVPEKGKEALPPWFFRALLITLVVAIVALPAWLYRWFLKAAFLNSPLVYMNALLPRGLGPGPV